MTRRVLHGLGVEGTSNSREVFVGFVNRGCKLGACFQNSYISQYGIPQFLKFPFGVVVIPN